jgi:cytochrome c
MKPSLQSVAALSSTLAAASLAVSTDALKSSRDVDHRDAMNTVAEIANHPHLSERTAARKLQSVCQSCHVGVPLGPPFWREGLCIFDQPAGTVSPEYPYTPALKNSGIVWNETTLDEWLQDPQDLIPGNVMSFEGLKGLDDAAVRQELIAAMKSLCDNTESPAASAMEESPTASPSEEDNSAGVVLNNYLWMGPTLLVGWLLVGNGRR